jgi:SPP1 gp7 family putative phage head morphogenesis protein
VTSNEEIRDGLVRHQIGLSRFGKGFERRLVLLLNKSEPGLREGLKARIERASRIGWDPGPATTSRMIKIEETYRTLMAPVWAEIRASSREELSGLAAAEIDYISALVASSLPVTLSPVLPSREELQLITSSTPVNGRILTDWFSGWEKADRDRAMAQVRTGVLFSETPTQISRRIFGTRQLNGTDGVKQVTRRGAQAFAQTTTAAITNGAKQLYYEKNKKFIDQEIYVATLDSRTSPICQSLDGNIYKRGKGPIPPVHMNCRSVRVPAINGKAVGNRPAVSATDKELKGLIGPARRARVEELVGTVPADTTYQQFLSRQSASFQNEVLGPTRGKLFREGGFTVDRFVDESGKRYTLDQLRAREMSVFNRLDL